MSQFDFLQPEWPDVYAAATKAEELIHPDARASCFYARRALELAVNWLYKHDSSLKLPYQDHLSALIHEPTPGTRPLVAWGMTLGIYALLGVGFGLLYLRSGRLDAVVLAHVLVNASGLYLLLANPF